MNLFVADAWAQGAPSQEPGMFGLLLPFLVIVVFWLFLVRPQMKRQKEHTKMVDALTKGDEAVTNGGLLGRISEVGDHFVTLQVAKNIEVKVEKSAIARIMPKGTIKGL